MSKYSENTVFIFDWDDTLLPSTWLRNRGVGVNYDSCTGVTTEMTEACAVLEPHVKALLTAAKEYGQVFIVTNATRGWLHISAMTFMPSVAALIPSLIVISAADLYDVYYSNPTVWKMLAFRNDVLTHAFPTQPAKCTVISIGDGEYEREALKHIAADAVPGSLLAKSVKFMDNPSPEILKRQLVSTLQEIDMIATVPESFDRKWEFPSLEFHAIPEAPAAPAPVPPPPPPKVPRILSMFTPFSVFGESSMPYIDTYIPPSPSPPPVPARKQAPTVPKKGRSVTPYRPYEISKEEEKN